MALRDSARNRRATCRSSSPTTARTPIVAKSASGRTICPSSTGLRAAGTMRRRPRSSRTWRTRTDITNFEALRTTNPALYQRMATNAFFTSATVQANRLLRPFSHYQHRRRLVTEPAARREQGAVGSDSRESPLRQWLHREHGVVVYAHPQQSHGQRVRPRANAVARRQQQPAVPSVGRRGVRAAVRCKPAMDE